MTESYANLTAMAESAARGGKYDEAKDCYKRALADADGRADAQNAYHTRCNYAGLLRLLDQYAEAEQLLKEAVHMRYSHPEHTVKEPVSPLTDLERILAKQNRLPELEHILYTDTERMFAIYGRETFEFKMSLMTLAKMYGTQMKDFEKCKTYFREVLDWANTQAEPITRKMIYNTYDGVLRGAGLHADADAAQAELAAQKKDVTV